MYNRYIPQSDGTYHRRPTPDAVKTAPTPPPAPAQKTSPPPKPDNPPSKHPTSGIGSFFKQIIPAGFDTGDLIVVLLLLLMAADNQEEQNTALLTLALYLFL